MHMQHKHAHFLLYIVNRIGFVSDVVSLRTTSEVNEFSIVCHDSVQSWNKEFFIQRIKYSELFRQWVKQKIGYLEPHASFYFDLNRNLRSVNVNYSYRIE